MSHAKWGLWLDGLQMCGIFRLLFQLWALPISFLIWCAASATVRMNSVDLRFAVCCWYVKLLTHLQLSILLTVLKIPVCPLWALFFPMNRIETGQQGSKRTHTHTPNQTHWRKCMNKDSHIHHLQTQIHRHLSAVVQSPTHPPQHTHTPSHLTTGNSPQRCSLSTTWKKAAI